MRFQTIPVVLDKGIHKTKKNERKEWFQVRLTVQCTIPEHRQHVEFQYKKNHPTLKHCRGVAQGVTIVLVHPVVGVGD